MMENKTKTAIRPNKKFFFCLSLVIVLMCLLLGACAKSGSGESEQITDIRQLDLGQAGRISGVSPADIAVLMIYLETKKR